MNWQNRSSNYYLLQEKNWRKFFFKICNNGELCTWFDKLVFNKLEFSFYFFPFKEKLYPPVCSTMPASLQARGCRPRDYNKGKDF